MLEEFCDKNGDKRLLYSYCDVMRTKFTDAANIVTPKALWGLLSLSGTKHAATGICKIAV